MTTSENTYISYYQFVILFIGFLYGSSTIVELGTKAKQDVWIAFIISWILGLILIYGYSVIAKLNPKKNLVQILITYFGKYIGGLISVLYIWYFIHLAALVFRNFGEFVVMTTLPSFSIAIIIPIFAIIIAYSTRFGIENIARVVGLIVPLLLLITMLFNVSFISQYEVINILPVLGNGFAPIINSSLSILSFPFGETIVFLMLFPHLKSQENIIKAPLIGTAIGGIIILLIILRNLLIFGPNLISMLIYPAHHIITLIPGFGLESLFNLTILIGGFSKTAVLLFATCSATSQLFKTNDYKPYVLPLASFIVSLSIWIYSNVSEMLRWADEVWFYYSMPFQLFIPFILLVLSLIKNHQKAFKPT